MTYGDAIIKARSQTDRQEVGETREAIEEHFAKIFCEAIEGNKNVKQDWYIWIRVRHDAYADNAMHLIPMTRLTRPSPYEAQDHYLWLYRPNRNELVYQWNIPSKLIVANVLANPTKYDPEWVRMLRKYQKGTLDQEYIIKENAQLNEQKHDPKLIQHKDFILQI